MTTQQKTSLITMYGFYGIICESSALSSASVAFLLKGAAVGVIVVDMFARIQTTLSAAAKLSDAQKNR